MGRIVGICGWQGCGKDTAADYLVFEHEFRRESFAATLKDAVAAVFGWDRNLLEGRTKESRAWREQVDVWWAIRLGMPHLTPRWVLQHWGTEVCRKAFHDDMWIASLENKLRLSKDDMVITDCRFPNEIKAIQEQGGKIIWVQRGPMPDWYETAIMANSGSQLAAESLKNDGVHASESSWVGTRFDVTIDNNGSVSHLYEQLANILY